MDVMAITEPNTPGTASECLAHQGFALVPSGLPATEIANLAALLTSSLNDERPDSHPLASRGTVYAARNPLDVLPDVQSIWRSSSLGDLLREILGASFGLVRGLYFDKPPGRSWWLPWHKDLTIAVRDNSLPSQRFTRPTFKAGVPHVIAPVELLEQMLTVRLHLDEVTSENGPLLVLPGSHLTGITIPESAASPVTILADSGEALLMRPLLAHSSGDSTPGTNRHRRILHLEFAPREELPDGYAWQRFLPG
jgi:hypothetical protein